MKTQLQKLRPTHPLPVLKPLLDLPLPRMGLEPPALPSPMVWTQSSIKLFRKCKRKFFWKYIARLTPRKRDVALHVGSMFHDALAKWYRAPQTSMVAIVGNKVKEEFSRLDDEQNFYDQSEIDDLRVLLGTFTGMMIAYSKQYQEDKKIWRVHKDTIEAEFKIPIDNFFFAGKIDLVAYDLQQKYDFFVEHKTISTLKESYLDRLALDTQVRGYLLGIQRGLDLRPREVLYDIVKKCKLRRKGSESVEAFNERVSEDYLSKPEKYFYREQLTYSQLDLAALEHELIQTNREYEFLIKSGDPEDPRTWGINDEACDEYFRTCPYQQLCTGGLDKGRAMMYRQRPEGILHEELADAN